MKSFIPQLQQKPNIVPPPINAAHLVNTNHYEPEQKPDSVPEQKTEIEPQKASTPSDNSTHNQQSKPRETEPEQAAPPPAPSIPAPEAANDTSVPDDLDENETDRYNADGEFVDSIVAEGGEFGNGVSGNDFDVLMDVCMNKTGTPSQIAIARQSFKDIEGSYLEDIIIAQMNDADGYVALLLDAYLSPNRARATEKTNHKSRSVTNFNMDDFV